MLALKARSSLLPGKAARVALLTTLRALDIALSLIGLLLTGLLCLPLSALNYLRSSGPLFYRQVRVGLHGETFTLIKFRTMIPDAERESGPVWATSEDPRVTRVGRYLRRCYIDEMPQFWNVLRGDMSVVGPRPERPEMVKLLSREIPHYDDRHAVKPGLTGWAQINYRYGSSVEDARIKLNFDMHYIKNRAVSLYLRIVLRTVWLVVLLRGT